MNELTEWYPAEIKPVRKGVYEKRVSRPGKFQYWCGEHWCAWATSVLTAEDNKDMKSSDQESAWRGLARKPK